MLDCYPGYRNIWYDSKNKCCRLFTWDELGNRIDIDIGYHPYLYLETTSETDHTSIYNTKLYKKSFETQFDRYKFVQSCGITRLFENISCDQQCLLDLFWEHSEDPLMFQFPLKIMYLDIECPKKDGFPNVENPDTPINLITVYDNLSQKFNTWGLQPLQNKKENCIYHYCSSEQELLDEFLRFIEKDYPDVISGWNIEGFDIPYIIGRIKNILGEVHMNRISPVNQIYSRSFFNDFGKQQIVWNIKGLSILDYLNVYKTFTPGMKESYKLDFIGKVELGESKVDYGNINLFEFSQTDWDKYVDYNIQDVNILVKLEEKLLYIQLIRMLAYVGCVSLESALGTISVVTGAAAIQARKEKTIILTLNETNDGMFQGAFVAEPEQGFQKCIISFDVNSLYPNTLISLNLSPETKVGKFSTTDENVKLHHINGKIYTLTHDKFKRLIELEKLSCSKSNTLFTQKKKGIFPQIIDRFYDERVRIKKKLKGVKTKLSEIDKNHPDYSKLNDEAIKLHIKQFTIKIFCNRVYGFFANKHSPMYDLDIAGSITLTGQSVIKRSREIVTEYVTKQGNFKEGELKVEDIAKYSDTDSVYLSIEKLLNKTNTQFLTNKGKVTKEAYKIIDDIEIYLNDEIRKWGKTELNSCDCRFEFKRESICDHGLFLTKKRYVLHVLDDEGFQVDKWKYVGVDVVRTTMPNVVKPYMKDIIQTMISTQDQLKTNLKINELYEKFKTLPIQDIAFTKGLKGYDKYADQCENMTVCKRMPIHVKASYFYNKILEKNNLQGKYEKINSGDKIKYFYVIVPNKYGIESFAYKYYFPTELEKDLKINYELMFEKIVYSVVERFFNAVNWSPQKPNEQIQTNLFNLLG